MTSFFTKTLVSSWTKMPSPHTYMQFNGRLQFLNNKHLLLVDHWKPIILWDHKEKTQHNVMTN